MGRLLGLVLLVAAGWGQTPADLYVYEEYRAWVERQAAEVRRSEEILDRYKEHLLAKGLDSVDAESQIRVIRAQGSHAEAERPSPFLVEMMAGRAKGRALLIGKPGGNGNWLTQQGWEVAGARPAEGAFGESRWDLVVWEGGDIRGQVGAVVRALRPGGVVVIEGRFRNAASAAGSGTGFEPAELPGLFRALRVVRYNEPLVNSEMGRTRVVRYCGEKAE